MLKSAEKMVFGQGNSLVVVLSMEFVLLISARAMKLLSRTSDAYKALWEKVPRLFPRSLLCNFLNYILNDYL